MVRGRAMPRGDTRFIGARAGPSLPAAAACRRRRCDRGELTCRPPVDACVPLSGGAERGGPGMWKCVVVLRAALAHARWFPDDLCTARIRRWDPLYVRLVSVNADWLWFC
jgi:hypothetical protein